jgi:hypothetical protein
MCQVQAADRPSDDEDIPEARNDDEGHDGDEAWINGFEVERVNVTRVEI